MSKDGHDDNDKPRDRGDNDKPTRDARGRWLPDYCPNRKGRPRKKPKMIIDESDIFDFGRTLIDVVSNGQMEKMTRRTALNRGIFESAMRGKVSQQRFMYKEFARNDERLAAARVYYDQMMQYWFVEHPDRHKSDFKIPIKVEAEMLGLRVMLNSYYPKSYPIDGKSANDEVDDDEVDDDDN